MLSVFKILIDIASRNMFAIISEMLDVISQYSDNVNGLRGIKYTRFEHIVKNDEDVYNNINIPKR